MMLVLKNELSVDLSQTDVSPQQYPLHPPPGRIKRPIHFKEEDSWLMVQKSVATPSPLDLSPLEMKVSILLRG